MDSTTQEQPEPFVTVIVPIRNEAEHVERTLRGILDNDYPAERMEVAVVDGMSDDGTREIVEHLATGDSRVRLVDNPDRTVPYAMNRGIESSEGEILIRVDGHMTIAPNFISESVRSLQEHPDVWLVGGLVETVGMTYIGRVVAAAMTSPIGVGPGSCRIPGGAEGYRDVVPFPAYWRWVHDRIGPYDEQLVRNQDDDFHQRVQQAGGKQYMSPAIRCRYFSRATLGKLARQYYQYGFWRVRTIQKHRRPARLRQVLPMMFVLGWISLIVSGLLWRPMWLALGAYAGIYGLALICGTVPVIRKEGMAVAWLVPLACAIMHFAYGLGNLKGIWSWLILGGRFVPGPQAHKMSR